MTENESRASYHTSAALGTSTTTHSTVPSPDIAVSDSRCRARLTERDLEPIDVALTFTGLAAEMGEVAL